VLDATDRHAAILSDVFLSIAVFSAPYDEMLKAAGVPAAELTGELSIGKLSDFSEKYDQGTRLYLDYVFHKWSDTSPPSDKWPTDRGFIRQGTAAGAARAGSRWAEMLASKNSAAPFARVDRGNDLLAASAIAAMH
jgi:hypothetical protein